MQQLSIAKRIAFIEDSNIYSAIPFPIVNPGDFGLTIQKECKFYLEFSVGLQFLELS